MKKHEVTDELISELSEKAQEAFWEVIAQHFSDCPGDFDPMASLHFERTCRSAIELWISWNVNTDWKREQERITHDNA